MHFFDAISSAQEFLSYRHCPRLNDMSECDALKTLQKCRPKGLPSRQTPVLEDDENDEVFIIFQHRRVRRGEDFGATFMETFG